MKRSLFVVMILAVAAYGLVLQNADADVNNWEAAPNSLNNGRLADGYALPVIDDFVFFGKTTDVEWARRDLFGELSAWTQLSAPIHTPPKYPSGSSLILAASYDYLYSLAHNSDKVFYTRVVTVGAPASPEFRHPITGDTVSPWLELTIPAAVFDSVTNPGVVATDSCLYVIGGLQASGAPALPTIQYAEVDQATGALTWHKTTGANSPNTRRSQLQPLIHNGRIYVAGGGPSNSINSETVDVERSTIGASCAPGAWSYTSPLPATMLHGAMTILDERMYSIDGTAYRGEGDASARNEVYSAQINTDGTLSAWQVEPVLNQIRNAAGAVTVGCRIYVAGGAIPGVPLTSVERSNSSGGCPEGPPTPTPTPPPTPAPTPSPTPLPIGGVAGLLDEGSGPAATDESGSFAWGAVALAAGIAASATVVLAAGGRFVRRRLVK